MPTFFDDMPDDYVPSQFFNLSRPMSFECIDCHSKIDPILRMQIWYPEKFLLVQPLCEKCFSIRMEDTKERKSAT
jgi:hypothetical protein